MWITFRQGIHRTLALAGGLNGHGGHCELLLGLWEISSRDADYHLRAIKQMSVELEGLEICVRIAKFYRGVFAITRSKEGIGV
ncbi:hypothetical protein AGABI1DRAFT_84801 [Agaricus bisporus var. burnettii JB137-S8]|uniref:Uncharacterized protein n=1 Tax=Agaricus bisporus var. burnettii (strain JB137-S8 / ATCC MYA-4627 / FGSC 10392) TaxID=597362 RepID=K5XYB3_AGABU|nr:uncharacterized protein AGABI1DRAFT_84801 [Agaricus bisporus var. burnettii JB137-S8]EKM80340.1 hypothetical protein AGABI1DRAFT_84801 [Agaricus bisporus var. burnettii JB137-S8]